MATLDKIQLDRSGGKENKKEKKAKKNKKEGGMNAAVASTEKIRSWVSFDSLN